MFGTKRFLRGAKLAAALAVGLALAACATNPNPADGQAALGGAAAPGSPQDFVVSVGDRVFFESDQTELTPQARQTLDKQAQWLQHYNRYTFTIEGDKFKGKGSSDFGGRKQEFDIEGKREKKDK